MDIKKKITAVAMAGAIAAGGTSLGSAEVVDPLLESQILHDQHKIEYMEYLENEDMSNYDEDFVEFYRNGKLKIGDREYSVGDLYIATGIENGEEHQYLVYYGFKEVKDLITLQEADDSFRRTSVIVLKDTYFFYEMFLKFKDSIVDGVLVVDDTNKDYIVEAVQNYNGTVHVESPETSYGRVKH